MASVSQADAHETGRDASGAPPRAAVSQVTVDKMGG
jgi:hypothetical protein